MEYSPNNKTLLVVDDDDSVRDFTVRILKSLSYNVLSAPDGQTALALFQEKTAHIDLVMTDMVMPNMTGKEFVEAVRGIDPHMKVLFVSGYGPDETLGDLADDPGIAFLQKPYIRNQLSETIRGLLTDTNS
jgi:DNA-binding NtrC family response regulator